MLVHSSVSRGGNTIMMRAITQKEEDRIDKLRDKSDIYIYGDVDLSNKKDIEQIRNAGYVPLHGKGMVYSNFDYEKGNYKLTPNYDGKEYKDVVKWGPCNNPLDWFKYNHCLIGKPAKVVIYNIGLDEFIRRT